VVAAQLDDGHLRSENSVLRGLTSTAVIGRRSSQTARNATMRCSDLQSPDRCQPLHVDEFVVRNAIMSFPAGSAGGPDGLHPQHMKQLISCRESGLDILTDPTAFANTVLVGRCPKSVDAV